MNSQNQHAESGPGSAQLEDKAETSVLDLADRIDSLVETYSSDGETTHNADGGNARVSAELTSFLPAVDNAPPPGAAHVASAAWPSHLQADFESASLVVADLEEEANQLAQHLTRQGYTNIRCVAPCDLDRACITDPPDAVLLAVDNDLSVMEGLRKQAADWGSVQTIVVTGTATSQEVKRAALALGATDLLSKPVDASELASRVRNALIIKRHGDHLADEKNRFEQQLRRRTAEVEASREQLILSLARAAEHRDNETGNHVLRVGCFAGLVAEKLGWAQDRVEMLVRAAQLHDVGKIGVPDEILFKPGRLDPHEFEMIKRHCAWGKQIIQPFSERELQVIKSHARIGEKILHVRQSPMLMLAARIAQTHHENWDGSGYPLGLAGEDIPLEGRITAVADMYDALSSKRPYKEAFPREKCFSILEEERGKKLDPRVLDAFFSQAERIIQVQLELMDDGEFRWSATDHNIA